MKKILLVGLGNPGERYQRTRHNLGANILAEWFTTAPDVYPGAVVAPLRESNHLNATVGEISITTTTTPLKIIALFPLTFMNESGRAVKAAVEEYHSTLTDLLVIHDDIEVPLGETSFKAAGSAAGHNGVRSIQQALATDAFSRLRLGVGRPPEDKPVDQFVLEPFTAAEQPTIAELTTKAYQTITEFVAGRVKT